MKKPHMGSGAGKEYINSLDKLYSTPPCYTCKNCGILTRWKLCPACYRWRVHFNAVQRAVKARGGI